MFCKYCGAKLPKNSSVCAACGKDNKAMNALKIVLASIAGVLLVTILVLVVIIGTNGSLNFGTTDPTEKPNVEQPATTPTDGNPEDVTCKGTYTAADDTVIAAKDTVVAKMGESTLTVEQLQVFYWMQVIDFMDYYGSYAIYYGLDVSKPLDQQVFDKETGRSWQQYFLDQALKSWTQYQSLYLESVKANFEMSEEYRKYFDGLEDSLKKDAEEGKYASVEDMIKADTGAASSYEAYHHYLLLYHQGYDYYSQTYPTLTVTQEQMEAYFTENKDLLEEYYGVTKDSGEIADVFYIHVMPDGATSDTIGTGTFTEAQWEAGRQKAQQILDEYKAGQLAQAAFEAMVEKYNADESTVTGGKAENLAAFSTSSVDVRHILIMPEGGTTDSNNKTTYTEAEWEAARVKAQGILDGWLAAGGKEEDFIELAKTHSKDGNASKGGIYEDVTKGYMVAEFDEWIFDESRKYGDSGLVKTQFGYHIMFFIHADCEFDRWTFDESRVVGDTTLVKTDFGYYVLFFVDSEEGWIRYSRQGAQSDKLAKDALAAHPYEIYYDNILLCEVKLSAS